MDNKIRTINIMSAETIAASGTCYGTPNGASASGLECIPLAQYRGDGDMSLQVKVTGDGTAQITYYLSNDGTNFRTPAGSSDIVTAHTKSSGSSGLEIYAIDLPMVAKYMKILVTETGGADTITVTLDLCMQ